MRGSKILAARKCQEKLERKVSVPVGLTPESNIQESGEISKLFMQETPDSVCWGGWLAGLSPVLRREWSHEMETANAPASI